MVIIYRNEFPSSYPHSLPDSCTFRFLSLCVANSHNLIYSVSAALIILHFHSFHCAKVSSDNFPTVSSFLERNLRFHKTFALIFSKVLVFYDQLATFFTIVYLTALKMSQIFIPNNYFNIVRNLQNLAISLVVRRDHYRSSSGTKLNKKLEN